MPELNIKQMITEIMRYYYWTQQDLAKYLGIDRSQVTRWMSGKQVPRAEAYSMLKEKYDEITAA